MTVGQNLGLEMSLAISGLDANKPSGANSFIGDYNLSFYYATDTNTLYVAVNPGPGGTPVYLPVIGAGPVLVPNAATYAVLPANTGKQHIMPDLTANDTITLPAVATGVFEFIGSAGAADAQSWIFVTSGTALLKGGVLGMDTDAGAGTDELVPAYANGTTHVKLTVATPDAGCRIVFIGNGTDWIVAGQVSSAAAPVFST